MEELADFLRNRAAWDAESDAYQAQHGAQLDAQPLAWGVWSLPESEIDLLGPVAGRDVLEYGCGAAQWSIALAQKGARVTGLDNSERQLAHAKAAIAAAGVDVTLVHAPAEKTLFADASFDIVFCDHGAMSFAAPELTIPEVARIVRRGGSFSFSLEHPVHAMCWNIDDELTRTLHTSYFTLGRFVSKGDGAVSHARPISTYVGLLIEHGFAIEQLLEPQPPVNASSSYVEFAPLDWARDFPAELLIRARRC